MQNSSMRRGGIRLVLGLLIVLVAAGGVVYYQSVPTNHVITVTLESPIDADARVFINGTDAGTLPVTLTFEEIVDQTNATVAEAAYPDTEGIAVVKGVVRRGEHQVESFTQVASTGDSHLIYAKQILDEGERFGAIDVRVVDGEGRTLMPEKRGIDIRDGFKSSSFFVTWEFDQVAAEPVAAVADDDA